MAWHYITLTSASPEGGWTWYNLLLFSVHRVGGGVRNEVETGRVDAVAEPRGFWSVLEYNLFHQRICSFVVLQWYVALFTWNTWPRWLPHSLQDTSVLIRLGSAMIRSKLPPTENIFTMNNQKIFNSLFYCALLQVMATLTAAIRKVTSPPEASCLLRMFCFSMTSKNDGQPEPESYFVLEENWSMPHTTHLYTPRSQCL